uniref:Methionine-tRNA synthetase n=1 Tax=Rhizophora mucronata TaxID=61149 RepID=A0A2P2QXB2_RHIMU
MSPGSLLPPKEPTKSQTVFGLNLEAEDYKRTL